MNFILEQIAVVHSPFKEKFGTPRQPGIVNNAVSTIELLPPYDREEALQGIEQFSHLWLSFIFHKNKQKSWTPKVRPPRLGGNTSIGVFASRSPYRPNPVGLSVVEFVGIRKENNKLLLDINGADLVDGTPVIDIKPYIPYTDSIKNARAGYAEMAPQEKLAVVFAEQASKQVKQFSEMYPDLQELIRRVIALDPRPAYTTDREADKQYGIRLLEFDVKWQVDADTATVIALD